MWGASPIRMRKFGSLQEDELAHRMQEETKLNDGVLKVKNQFKLSSEGECNGQYRTFKAR
jgi:hypothetical protein